MLFCEFVVLYWYWVWIVFGILRSVNYRVEFYYRLVEVVRVFGVYECICDVLNFFCGVVFEWIIFDYFCLSDNVIYVFVYCCRFRVERDVRYRVRRVRVDVRNFR